MAVNVYFLCVFVQFPVLWTSSARVWQAADGTVRAMRNSSGACSPSLRSPGAGPARGGTSRQARVLVPGRLWVSGLMPNASSREQKQ